MPATVSPPAATWRPDVDDRTTQPFQDSAMDVDSEGNGFVAWVLLLELTIHAAPYEKEGADKDTRANLGLHEGSQGEHSDEHAQGGPSITAPQISPAPPEGPELISGKVTDSAMDLDSNLPTQAPQSSVDNGGAEVENRRTRSRGAAVPKIRLAGPTSVATHAIKRSNRPKLSTSQGISSSSRVSKRARTEDDDNETPLNSLADALNATAKTRHSFLSDLGDKPDTPINIEEYELLIVSPSSSHIAQIKPFVMAGSRAQGQS